MRTEDFPAVIAARNIVLKQFEFYKEMMKPDNGEAMSTTLVDPKNMSTLALMQRITELEDTLQFVERWAVHHGTKSHMTAENALSIIQHYPPISAITKGYADGKVPDTFNPYARITELEAQLAAVKPEGEPVAWHTEDHLTDRSATTYNKNMMHEWLYKGWPVTPLYTHLPAPKDDGSDWFYKLKFICRVLEGNNPDKQDMATALGMARSLFNEKHALEKL